MVMAFSWRQHAAARHSKGMIEIYDRESDPAGGPSEYITLAILETDEAWRLAEDIQRHLVDARKYKKGVVKTQLEAAKIHLETARQRVDELERKVLSLDKCTKEAK
jgi:hypothetical protein